MMNNAVAEQVNELGVKVGDVFIERWGYYQENVYFWQVDALEGSTQIVLGAISHHTVKEEFNGLAVKPIKGAWSCHISGNKLIKTVKGTAECPYIENENRKVYKTSWDVAHIERHYF